jgi:hypothetical protein
MTTATQRPPKSGRERIDSYFIENRCENPMSLLRQNPKFRLRDGAAGEVPRPEENRAESLVLAEAGT